jgi:predicted metal-binding protein
MSKTTLFICKSCHHLENRPEDQPADGTLLLDQTSILAAEQSDLEIKAVGCLWTCGYPRSAAFSNPHKPTYLFTNLPTEAATALLEFGNLYSDSNTGDIPWKQFPETLQTASIAKIPSVK